MKRGIVMTKRILAFVLACAMLFALCSCGKSKEDEGEKPSADEKAFTIDGIGFRMDEEKSFCGINYEVSGEFREVDHFEFTPYIQYNYLKEDSSNLLYFRIFYYKGQGNEAAVKDLGIEGEIDLEDGKANGIEYQKYVTPRDDGGTMDFYFIHRDGDTYVLSFVSRYDISEFEQKVVNSISF